MISIVEKIRENRLHVKRVKEMRIYELSVNLRLWWPNTNSWNRRGEGEEIFLSDLRRNFHLHEIWISSRDLSTQNIPIC